MRRLIDILAKVVLWATFLLMPFLAHAGGLGIAPFGFTMGCAGLLLAIAYEKIGFNRNYLFVIPFLLFLLWANLSALWSPYEATGLTNAHKIAVIGASLVFVPCLFGAISQSEKPIFRQLFMATSVMAVGLMMLDVLSGWGLSIMVDPVGSGQSLSDRQSDALMNVGHGFFTYAQFAAPLLVLFLTGLSKPWGWVVAVLFSLCLAIGSYLNLLNIASLTLCVVLAVMVIAKYFPRFTAGASLFTLAFTIIGAPILGMISKSLTAKGALDLPVSWEHRLHMWTYCWDEIRSAPIIGQGFDASRIHQDSYIGSHGFDLAYISLHPHNIGIQIWLELGFIGAILLTFAVLGLWRPVMNYVSNGTRSAALCGGLIAITIIGATTIGVWQFWWWGSIAFIIGVLTLIPAGSVNELPPISA